MSLLQAVVRHKNLRSLQGPISSDTEWSVRLRWGIPIAFGGCPSTPSSIPVLKSTQIDSSGVWCQGRQWLLGISPRCHWQVMLQIPWPRKEGRAGRGEQSLRGGRPFGWPWATSARVGIKCFYGLVSRRSWRGMSREAWLSLIMVGMRKGTCSLVAHSPKGGGYSSCLLSAVYGSCGRGEVSPSGRIERRDCLVHCLSVFCFGLG